MAHTRLGSGARFTVGNSKGPSGVTAITFQDRPFVFRAFQMEGMSRVRKGTRESQLTHNVNGKRAECHLALEAYVITGGSGPPLQLVHAGYCFYPKPKKDDSLLVLDISLGAAEDTGAVCRSTGIALVLVYSISGLELYSGVICYHFEYGFETVRNGASVVEHIAICYSMPDM